MTWRSIIALSVALAAVATTTDAVAQAAPSAGADEIRGRALFDAGVLRYNHKRFAEAAVLFEDAYRLFPNPSILINVALTMERLKRAVDAANAYQRFLDAPDHNPAKVAEVTMALTALDAAVARIDLDVTATDATPVSVNVDDGPWLPLPPSHVLRVAAGQHVVAAKGGGVDITVEAPIDAVVAKSVTASLRLIVDPPVPSVEVAVVAPPIEAMPTPPPADELVGGLAHVAIHPTLAGVTAVIGATFAIRPRLRLRGGAMIGGNYAGFATITASLLQRRIRPTATLGAIVSYDPAHALMDFPGTVAGRTYVGAHAALGGEWIMSRRLTAIAELAIDFYPSAVGDRLAIDPLALTPTAGVQLGL
jgi:hypothetical protein